MIIRPWEADDEDALRPMVRDYLRTQYNAGADIPPTDKNVDVFLNMGMETAARGDPALIASNGGSDLVGYLLWTAFTVSDLELRPGLCLGMGTYVRPEYRRQHVAIQLRQFAKTVAKMRGYHRVKGTAYHDAGLHSAVAAGFIPTGREVELIL